jgi:hypothetical protein
LRQNRFHPLLDRACVQGALHIQMERAQLRMAAQGLAAPSPMPRLQA